MTAVEFLVETLDQNHAIIMNYVDLQKLIEKAKEMEKEQKKEYFRIGWNSNKHKTWNCEFYLIKHFNNETFKSE
jgi:hypothetical protein